MGMHLRNPKWKSVIVMAMSSCDEEGKEKEIKYLLLHGAAAVALQIITLAK